MGNTSTKNEATGKLTEEQIRLKGLTEEELFEEVKKQLDESMRTYEGPYITLKTSENFYYFYKNLERGSGKYIFDELLAFLDSYKRPYIMSMGIGHALTIHFVRSLTT
jgi:hypothetical protein